MKRKKKRLVEEFERLDLQEKTFQFQFSDKIYVRLMFTTRGRWISLRDDDYRIIRDYLSIYTTPNQILKASIEFLKSYRGYEKE